MKSWIGTDGVLPDVEKRRRGTRTRFFTAALATSLILLGLKSSLPALKHQLLPWFVTLPAASVPTSSDKPYDWDNVEATDSLEFQPCYDGFECAKLKLPLDHFNGTYPDSTISLAITKLPARVSIDDPRYGGPVLINPGGPGGPGAYFALLEGNSIQSLIDSAVDPDSAAQPDDFLSSEKYFDIIGFDPRGISWSTPGTTCMPDSPSLWSWRLREQTEGMLGSSDAALGRLWSMNHAYGSSCKQATDDEEGPDIKQYMSTASVARDMLEIVERHAEYVAKKIAQIKAEKSQTLARCPRGGPQDHNTPGLPKLQYYGFSYGTYLGATFASMFPDRVGRMILDGVVNSDDYNSSLGNGSMHDSDKAMASFYTYCVHVGPEICPLATINSTAKDVELRVHNVVQSLYHNPIQVSSPHGPEILTYTNIKYALFTSIYQPMVFFPFIAQLLAAVEQGGGSMLDDLVRAQRPAHIYSCSINGSVENQQPHYPEDATIAILCSDGHDQTDLDIKSFEEYFHLLAGISKTAGAIWSLLRMKCASWKIKAVHKFGDNFGAKTSHPILWISNTADPVTPLRSGRIMQSRFPGSALLVQDSAGHCSSSTPTPCTTLHIRTYFQTGVIPPPNTLCVPPTSPFSLNSTNPVSPFYDFELANSLSELQYQTMDSQYWTKWAGSEEGMLSMKAAKSLQKGVAGNGWFTTLGKDEPVHRMMTSWAKERIVSST